MKFYKFWTHFPRINETKKMKKKKRIRLQKGKWFKRLIWQCLEGLPANSIVMLIAWALYKSGTILLVHSILYSCSFFHLLLLLLFLISYLLLWLFVIYCGPSNKHVNRMKNFCNNDNDSDRAWLWAKDFRNSNEFLL